MKQTNIKLGIPGICLMLCALASALAGVAAAQAFGTTTVQGTVYLANGKPGSGTLQLSWPAFTTAANQAVTAGRTTVSIGSDGFVTVNLAPNLGSLPAGLYYTAVYHLSDGTTSTEYWVVPSAAQAAIAQVRATVMPAAQAVQAVNKAYVDQSIAQLVQSQVTSSGGNMTGPLYLNGDPATPTQAATKHYVDNQFSQTLSINGGAATGPLTATQLGAAYQADQFQGADFGAKLQACINALNSTYGGSCDARNFSGTLSMGSNVSISKANVTLNLPCATIATGSQIIVTAGTRNVTLHGCASRGTTAASGNQGGTVFLYSGSGAMIQVGDSTYASDTLGFHLDNVVLNTTSSASATAQAVTVWRAQELHLEGLYLLGNANQTGITLDGTGNYTGGTFDDVEIGGFQTALNAIGHQAANAATTDWLNASTFVRLHIFCPTANGSAIAGTTGINLAQGDGNTFTGGDVESCATALHLGANAQNNTIVGLRNENSTYQVVADTGSAYNNWITGGTMFTGKLTDNGTRNSFLDTFHRSFNALNGDWFGSQQDTTLTNHFRLGIGSGNERGLLNRYQTDSGYRWTTGLSDAAAGEQYYTVLDELNNVNRLSIGQYNTGQGSSNNQTVVNAAGTGAVILNGSNNAGSGGVVFGSGGPSSATVATINNAGNAQFNGSLQVSGASTFLSSATIKNQADAEIDAFLWAGATAPQKESVIYKDWNGNSQWYMVKDASNNWALNSAVGGVDSFKAYQSTNSGDTYLDAANNAGVVRVNYEPGSGSAFNVYGGGSGNLYASFNGTTGIKFPGLAAGSGHNCMQIDNSGYLSNTGVSCGSSSVGSGTTGQIAYYAGNGTTVTGMASSGALATLGGLPMAGGTMSGPLAGTSASFSGNVQAPAVVLGSDQPTGHQAASANAAVNVFNVTAYGGVPDWTNVYPNNGGSITSGSTTLTCGSCGFTSAVVGKAVVLQPNGTWTPPFAPIASNALLNSAYIAAFISSSQITMSRASTVTENIRVEAVGTDNSLAAIACENAVLASPGHNGTCVFSAGNWLFASALPMIYGAYDDGSVLSGFSQGGSGAVLSCSILSGSLSGCSVTNGGSGYTDSSTLQTTISGNGCVVNASICGNAWVTVSTNSSGVVTSATVVYPGWGFTTPPTVTVNQLGGDGATATATLTGTTMNVPTMTAGGSGYGASSNLGWVAIGGGCTQLQGGTAGQAYVGYGTVPVNSSGAASGTMTVTTNATGCTFAPTIVFGSADCNLGTLASPVFGQCSNKAPINPATIPVNVPLVPGVSWAGTGGASSGGTVLHGAWDTVTVDNNQAAIFGGQIAYMDMTNFNFMNDAFMGVYGNNNANYSYFNGLSFNSAIGMYTASTDLGFRAGQMNFGGLVSWVNGGGWNHRIEFPVGNGGFFDAEEAGPFIVRLQPYGGPGSGSQKLDDWFANNIWHPEFTGASLDFPETCKFPQSVNQRQSALPFFSTQYATNKMCYRGISSIGMAIYTRDARATGGAIFNTLSVKQVSRYLFLGSIGSMQMSNISCENCLPILGTNDPYRNATTQEGNIVYYDGSSGNGNIPVINGYNSYGGTSNPTQDLWDISGTPAGAPNLNQIQWYNKPNGGTVAQPAQNYVFGSKTNFPAGASIGAGSSTGQSLDFYGMYGNANSYTGSIRGFSNYGVSFYGADGVTELLRSSVGGVNVLQPMTAPSFTLNGGTQATGTVGNGGELQETTTATKTSGNPVAWDGAGNTVNATAANIFSLFTGCSGTQYPGFDGACHNSASYTLPAASTSTLGGVKCDGTTTTCAGDGTITAAAASGATIVQATAPTTTTTMSPFNLINYTVPAGGSGHLYRACWVISTPIIATAGTFSLQSAYSFNLGHGGGGFIGGNTSMTSATTINSGCSVPFQADPSTAITYSVGFVGVTGTPKLLYAATLEKLQ